MHILFFNRSFYPDTAATGQILTDLCEELVQTHKCRVTVISGMPLLPEKNGSAHLEVPVRENYCGIEIRRAHGTQLSKRRFLGRVTNYATYFLSACAEGLKVDRPDVVVALTDPPIIGLAGWLAAKRYGAPFVMSFQDLFPEVAVLLEDFRSDTVNAALQRVNQFLCRHATRIVALGETMRQRLIEGKGAAPEKTVVIPSGADTAAIVPGPRQNAFSTANGFADKFVVMHSGNLGLSQSLETVVDAAAELRRVPDIQIVFQGEGVKKADLQARVTSLGLTNVTFLPFQPKDRLGESFASADVFIVSLQTGLAGYIVPSKLYGILAAGRPYVAAVEETCEVAMITRTHACGLVSQPADPRDLAEKILRFYRDRSLAAQYGASARTAALEFDKALLATKYMTMFSAIMRTDRATASAETPSGRSHQETG